MSHPTALRDGVLSAMAKDHFEMVVALATAMSIATDLDVQSKLRLVANAVEGRPFLVTRHNSRVWLEIGKGQEAKIRRTKIEGLPSVDLDRALKGDAGLLDTVQAAAVRAIGTASSILLPLIDSRTLPSREQFRLLRQWSPFFEHLSYKCGARLMAFLDILRPEVTVEDVVERTGSEEQLSSYWSGMHAMSHMFLLASDVGARPWLSAMADHLHWTNWTPTFPLVRERTMWLAACAARSAAAFGEPVVDKYLRKLSATTQAMKAFDALYGLTSIALSEPSIARSILLEVKSLKNSLRGESALEATFIEQSYVDAIDLISTADQDIFDSAASLSLGWHKRSKRGLATTAALCRDPTEITATGRFLGFAVLRTALAATPENFYSAENEAKRTLDISHQNIARIIARAWATSPTREEHRLLH